jgi:hypothetical protein
MQEEKKSKKNLKQFDPLKNQKMPLKLMAKQKNKIKLI